MSRHPHRLRGSVPRGSRRRRPETGASRVGRPGSSPLARAAPARRRGRPLAVLELELSVARLLGDRDTHEMVEIGEGVRVELVLELQGEAVLESALLLGVG